MSQASFVCMARVPSSGDEGFFKLVNRGGGYRNWRQRSCWYWWEMRNGFMWIRRRDEGVAEIITEDAMAIRQDSCWKGKVEWKSKKIIWSLCISPSLLLYPIHRLKGLVFPTSRIFSSRDEAPPRCFSEGSMARCVWGGEAPTINTHSIRERAVNQ